MRTQGRATLAVALITTLLGVGCATDLSRDNQSQVDLVISNITTQAGGQASPDSVGNGLFSDVTPVFNDNATLTLRALPKNRNLNTLSPLEDVILERYEVRYYRSDGRNQEGVDVPYRISGTLAATVPSSGALTNVAMVIVRHQAKLEPPLIQLGAGSPFGGQLIITVIGEITVHGRTVAGDAVTASGNVMITFADYADD